MVNDQVQFEREIAQLRQRVTAIEEILLKQEALLATVQKNSRRVASIEALFFEAVRLLRDGSGGEDIHDELRRFLEQQEGD